MAKTTRNHFVVPDTQVKPKVPTAHLEWAGKFVAERRPTNIIIIGDWWDMASLSIWTPSKQKILSGYTVMKDYKAGCEALERFMAPWCSLRNYKPTLDFTKGNHEHRIDRYKEANPEIDSLPDPDSFLRDRGWRVHPFLHPTTIDGITYCHFFCKDAKGNVNKKPSGSPSALQQCRAEMRHTVAGHKQGIDTEYFPAGGRVVRGIIAGSFYQHTEGYKTPHGNDHWQGCLMLNDVRPKGYDLEEVSLDRLRRMYR